jgi:hypothetical protein
MIKYYATILSLGVLFTSGCGTTAGDMTNVEDDYGNSVKQMVQAQIYDPNAANFPSRQGPMSYDGDKAVRTLESYRKDIPKPESVSEGFDFDIDRNN